MSAAKKWYFQRDGQNYGPLSSSELQQLAQAGQLLPDDLVWKEGMPEWINAAKCKGLFTKEAIEPEKEVAAATSYVEPQVVDEHDVRPILPRTETNCISKVEQVREQIYGYFTDACRAEGVEALIIRTPPFATPVGLRFTCWVPHDKDATLRDRSNVEMSIVPCEFHQYEYVINIEMKDNSKTRTYNGVVDFTHAHARAIVKHLLRASGSQSPPFGLRRLRVYWFQLWRPRNKLIRLRKDWLRPIGTLIIYLAFPLLIFFAYVGVPTLLGVPVLLAGLAVVIYSYLRYSYTISSGKPSQEPRLLIRLDSWQTLVPTLGGYEERIRKDLDKELKGSQRETIVLEEERIWHWGVDGIEERRQVVGRLRRGLAFVHVYRYGDDLFVGWDAHVNAGDWAEKEVATGVDPRTGELCTIMSIENGWRAPGEYDLFDTICLAEWIHLAVTKVVKRTLKEHKIDYEIDYQIIRESRQDALKQRQTSPSAGGGGIIGRIARGLGFRREG